MSDPYRPSYPENFYLSQDPHSMAYAPDGYGDTTVHQHQHQLQLSQSRSSPHEYSQPEPYYRPGGSRSGSYSRSSGHHHHHHSTHSRSRSRRGSSTHRHRDDEEVDRSDDSSTKSHRQRHGGSGAGDVTKRALGVVVGAGAGGLLGREVLGGGTVGTVSGMLVGAIGAQALERRHERHKQTRRASYGDGESQSHSDRKEGLRDRIGNFLAVPGHGDEARKRSRSHTDELGRRRSKRDDSDNSESEDERGRWRRY